MGSLIAVVLECKIKNIWGTELLTGSHARSGTGSWSNLTQSSVTEEEVRR